MARASSLRPVALTRMAGEWVCMDPLAPDIAGMWAAELSWVGAIPGGQNSCESLMKDIGIFHQHSWLFVNRHQTCQLRARANKVHELRPFANSWWAGSVAGLFESRADYSCKSGAGCPCSRVLPMHRQSGKVCAAPLMVIVEAGGCVPFMPCKVGTTQTAKTGVKASASLLHYG